MSLCDAVLQTEHFTRIVYRSLNTLLRCPSDMQISVGRISELVRVVQAYMYACTSDLLGWLLKGACLVVS